MQPTTEAHTSQLKGRPWGRPNFYFSQALTHLSTAGFGVVGFVGPRTGTSSGVFPGRLSGGGGAPGSPIGGGASGCGLPGSSSGGGSVGLPGVGGDISGGSVGAAKKRSERLIMRLGKLV